MANESFSYLGSILSYLIIAIPIFAGVFDGKDASELSAIISAVCNMGGTLCKDANTGLI